MTDESFDREFSNSEPVVDAMIVIDADGRIADWTTEAEALFGWPRQEAVGRLVPSLLIPDRHRDAFWEGLQKLKAGDASTNAQPVEAVCLHQNGAEVLIELTIKPLRLRDQDYFCGLVQDLSAQRRRQLTSSRRIMQSQLLRQSAVISSTEDSFEESLQKCIDTLCSITGWPIGWVLTPSTTKGVFCSTDIQCFAEDHRLKSFTPGPVEIRAEQAGDGFLDRICQGNTAWTSEWNAASGMLPEEFRSVGFKGAFGFPVKAENDVVAILLFFSWEPLNPDPPMLILINNLRDQLGRRIERTFWREERARLAAIVDSSFDAIIGKDVEGRIISWNTGAKRIYGYKAEEVLKKSISLILPEGTEREESGIRDVVRTGKRVDQLIVERRRKDGSRIFVAVTASPIRNSRGHIVGSSTIERDVTRRRQRDQELRKAIRDAEQANQAKGEFLANISHELRTPMNAILGMLNLSLGEDLSEVTEDYLTTARDSAETLLSLLNDLLDFSRMDAGGFELDEEPFSLRETLDAVMKSLSLQASEKGLELACHVCQDVPYHLLGDGGRLRQMVVNLAGNAIKFTSQGEVVVDVKQLKNLDDKVLLQFSVRDTGIGISREDQERIFTPFTQVDASTTREVAGTGLGLTIVRALVEKMQGTMGVESELNKGSRFYFNIPLQPLSGEPSVPPDTELADLPVLVVDDNRTNQVIMEETLANWSLRPTVVSDAKSGLKALRDADETGEPFALVISDGLMPEVDGFTMVEEMQRGRDESQVPLTVLMLSSADRQTFKKRCEHLQIAAYLEKPVSQSELLDTVMTVLRGPQLSRDSVEKLQSTRHGMRVLLAEDTPANQKVVCAILDKRGHEVQVANNGREAVDFIRQNSYDVVLMDVQMPTMDGLQATKMIRELPSEMKSDIPIIAMTAHARREDRRKCLASGMDAYISKPVDAIKLIQLLESVERRTKEHPSTDTWEGSPVAVSSQPEAESLINIQSALSRMGDDKALVIDLARFFLEDAPKLCSEVEQAIRDSDAVTMERAAHSLKGLAANFDAEALILDSQRMETYGQQADFRTAKNDLPALNKSLQRVARELESFILQNEGTSK